MRKEVIERLARESREIEDLIIKAKHALPPAYTQERKRRKQRAAKTEGSSVCP